MQRWVRHEPMTTVKMCVHLCVKEREVQSDGCQVQPLRVGVTAVLRAPPQRRCQGGVSDGRHRGSRGLLVFLKNTRTHTDAHGFRLSVPHTHTHYHLLFGLQVNDSSAMEHCLIFFLVLITESTEDSKPVFSPES